MSIDILQAIADLKAQRRLYAVLPKYDSDRRDRALLVTNEIYRCLNPPWSSEGDEKIWGQAYADLLVFVEGGWINRGYMKPLKQEVAEVWEIRVRTPRPQIRIFGAFAKKDVFVGTSFEYRPYLGKLADWEGKRNWREAIVRSQTIWRQLFPTCGPLTGVNINDYVSEKTHDDYNWSN